ncbi:MAG: hypothetical protein ACRC20_08825 [Segniliparus sp.]|uniref:hypothetical protein n=1 Tax=Segniliparus sp. TaxID=2804064 RepID=UPI003F2C1136
MAIYNEGGCCGGQQLYVDTDKIAGHVQTFQSASETFGSLAGSVDFAGAASALAGTSLASILSGGADVLGTALKSHGERANVTAENFHSTVLEYQDEDEGNASTLRDVVA